MTIAELIEKLKEYPQDLRVVVRGYEAGVDDVGSLEEINILLNYYGKDQWYYGRHDKVYAGSFGDKNYEKVPALEICGRE